MKILFLQKRFLYPTNTGGKIRTYNIVRHLAEWHEVTYLCNVLPEEEGYRQDMLDLGLDLEAIPWREPPRRSLRFTTFAIRNLLSSDYPLNVDKDFDPRLRQRAAELLRAQQFDLLVCDFVQMARNAVGLPVASLLFQHNVEAEIFERLAGSAPWPFSAYLRRQQRRMARFENEAGHQFDRVVAVSRRDRELFEQRYGWRHVDVIDTAVDVPHFRPAEEMVRNSSELVFIGSLDWLPNVQGIQHFVKDILPRIRQAIPEARVRIVGRNPVPSVQRLRHQPGVELVGGVPDTRPYLHSAAVAIVPLYAGGGTRLKIFEAMAGEAPVVSTRLGAEGLGLEHDRHLLLADRDEDFAAAVVSLLRDQPRARGLAETAAATVREHYGTEVVARQFEASCSKAVAGQASAAS